MAKDDQPAPATPDPDTPKAKPPAGGRNREFRLNGPGCMVPIVIGGVLGASGLGLARRRRR
ncbi:MAG: hypothetical protein IPM45_05620 [Acidimicrobiales bacterium]|nr:hypothetical protein [Acidimicrobiales bacterium]